MTTEQLGTNDAFGDPCVHHAETMIGMEREIARLEKNARFARGLKLAPDDGSEHAKYIGLLGDVVCAEQSSRGERLLCTYPYSVQGALCKLVYLTAMLDAGLPNESFLRILRLGCFYATDKLLMALRPYDEPGIMAPFVAEHFDPIAVRGGFGERAIAMRSLPPMEDIEDEAS